MSATVAQGLRQPHVSAAWDEAVHGGSADAVHERDDEVDKIQELATP